jgi:hypothetical protein
MALGVRSRHAAPASLPHASPRFLGQHRAAPDPDHGGTGTQRRTGADCLVCACCRSEAYWAVGSRGVFRDV